MYDGSVMSKRDNKHQQRDTHKTEWNETKQTKRNISMYKMDKD